MPKRAGDRQGFSAGNQGPASLRGFSASRRTEDGLGWGRSGPGQGEACRQPAGCVGTKWLTVGHFVSLALPVGKPVVTSRPSPRRVAWSGKMKKKNKTKPEISRNKKEVGKVFNSSPTLPRCASTYSTAQSRATLPAGSKETRSEKMQQTAQKNILDAPGATGKQKIDICQTSHKDKLLLTSHRPGEPLGKARPAIFPGTPPGSRY